MTRNLLSMSLLWWTRIAMLIGIAASYLFMSEDLTLDQRRFVELGMMLFAANHALYMLFPKRFIWIFTADLLLALGFGVAIDPKDHTYLLFYGIESMTLMLMTNRRQVVVWWCGSVTLIWAVLVGVEYVQTQEITLFSNLFNYGFFVFATVVGWLIRYYQQSRQEFAKLYEELRAYARQVEEMTAVRERNHIAREIHDTVGHKMTALLVQLQAGRKLLEHDRERSHETLLHCEELARAALQEVRLSVRTLRDEETAAPTVTEALRRLLAEFAKMTGLEAKLIVQGDLTLISASWHPAIYRIVQEALTNAKRHGEARSATVLLAGVPDSIVLEISDDGAGVAQIQPGFGLLNMRDRVTELGGTVQFTSVQGEGFRIEVRIPLQQQVWRFGGTTA
ncbi:sensor histidine kinase [Tumebacillus permanentifrigoris]|uniref:histidine kinase n=1 Tax=Tumebacillus permanentifrigoris TaxID=378543 RepID=A0A316DGZ8_9BACL|nr:sensor histidine kinase [Tumebacillus permanentifrigoris]PWK15853.1 signal transduction histidine kinase [Tumebacillus permanentifrigoris]